MDTNLSPVDMALALTHRSGHAKYKMAAVIADKRGRKVAWGWNHESPMRLNEFYSAHAEHHAISRAKKLRLHGATIHVVGVKPNGNVITAKPCEKCQRLCMKYGIEEIVYSASGGLYSMRLKYV